MTNLRLHNVIQQANALVRAENRTQAMKLYLETLDELPSEYDIRRYKNLQTIHEKIRTLCLHAAPESLLTFPFEEYIKKANEQQSLTPMKWAIHKASQRFSFYLTMSSMSFIGLFLISAVSVIPLAILVALGRKEMERPLEITGFTSFSSFVCVARVSCYLLIGEIGVIKKDCQQLQEHKIDPEEIYDVFKNIKTSLVKEQMLSSITRPNAPQYFKILKHLKVEDAQDVLSSIEVLLLMYGKTHQPELLNTLNSMLKDKHRWFTAEDHLNLADLICDRMHAQPNFYHQLTINRQPVVFLSLLTIAKRCDNHGFYSLLNSRATKKEMLFILADSVKLQPSELSPSDEEGNFIALMNRVRAKYLSTGRPQSHSMFQPNRIIPAEEARRENHLALTV